MSIRFFRKHPALALGMYLTIGSGAFFQPVVLFAIIPLLLAEKRASWKGILLTALAFFYTKSLYQLPSDKEVRGDAYFKILSIRTHHTPFTTCMRYEGICVRFQQAGSEIPSAKNIPCSIYVPCKNRPIGNIDYVIKNIDLIKIAPNRHILKLNKSTSWIQAKHSKSFAEKRFTLKKSMQTYLKSHFRNKKVYHLMSALATGHLEHRNLSYEFGRLGLQHVVAISGFHFALIALFFTLFLRIFLSLKALTICLILLVTLYYFYIGNSPSILRAWIGMMVLLIGIALNLKTTGLNLLGIALCYSIITEPILVTNLGFQLSFGATFGILIYYSLFEKWLETFLPKRTLNKLLLLPPLHQYGAIAASMIRSAFAINLAVHLTLIPILLYQFHHFPWLSLIYNLFIPAFITVAIFLLLLGCLFPMIHPLNEIYCSKWLLLLASPPKQLDFHIRVREIPFPLLLGILIVIFFGGIYLKEKESILELQGNA